MDPGTVRVGVAIADEETWFARPLEVIDRATTDPVTRLRALAAEHDVTRVIVGRPVRLTGDPGHAVETAEPFVAELDAALDVPVLQWDERLTTVVAEQGLRAGGAKAKNRKAIRDAVAAQVMLQGWLDAHRTEAGEA